MSTNLPAAGAATKELARKANEWWLEAATKAGIDLTGFNAAAPLEARIAWALSAGLAIALTYLRFSSKMQHSDEDQARANATFAAQNRLYLPPEFVCSDQAVTGRRTRRDGLERVKAILEQGTAKVLLVYSLSRLFRRSYEAYRFVQEEVVEAGARAVSVSQGVDTADERSWKLKLQVNGWMDEELLEGIAQNCREGLRGLFLKGWVTGALPVGYRAVEVAGAPLTNRGRPRMAPQVVPEVAELIRQHYEWIRDGMTLAEGLRRWRAAGGPCDPRAKPGPISATAYRRMLSRIAYTGRWEFGRKRNRFSTKLDYTQQIDQPESQWAVFLCEDLRIVDDQLYLEVQQRLAELKLGPRGPKKTKQAQLWDLITEFYHCAHCSTAEKPVRFYQSGAHSKGMQCKNGRLCPGLSAVKREEACRAMCKKATELLHRDAELIRDVLCRARQLDAEVGNDLEAEISAAEKRVRTLGRRIEDLMDLAGQGSEEDREQVKAKIRAAQAERNSCQLELPRLRQAADRAMKPITPQAVSRILADFATLLEDAAAGRLGEDMIYRATAVFRRITGGKIMVHVEKRPGRKHSNVRAVFRPQVIQAVATDADAPGVTDAEPCEEVEVWLREPPRVDRLAEPVHQLVDVEGLSLREAAKVLQSRGENVNSGNIWYSRRRYFEMRGLPVPELPYNNGQPRRSA